MTTARIDAGNGFRSRAPGARQDERQPVKGGNAEPERRASGMGTTGGPPGQAEPRDLTVLGSGSDIHAVVAHA